MLTQKKLTERGQRVKYKTHFVRIANLPHTEQQQKITIFFVSQAKGI